MGYEQWEHLGKVVVILSPPAIGQNADGCLQVFARRSDGALIYRAEEKPGSDSWREWRLLVGNVYEPQVASNVDGRLEVFVKGGASRRPMAPMADGAEFGSLERRVDGSRGHTPQPAGRGSGRQGPIGCIYARKRQRSVVPLAERARSKRVDQLDLSRR